MILKEIDLPLVNHDDCEDKLRQTRLGEDFKLHDSFVCAGGVYGKDTCQGDSGGPLWVEEEGKVELTSSDISLISPSPGNTGRTGQQRPRLRIPELSRHLHEVRAEVSEVT